MNQISGKSAAFFLLFVSSWFSFAAAQVQVPTLTFGDEPPAAAPITDGKQVVDLSTAWSATGVQPGERITLAVVLTIKPDWHTNANPVREPFIPTVVEIGDAPPGFVFTTPIYPGAHRSIDPGDGPVAVYDGKAVVYVPLAVGTNAELGEHTVTVNVRWQACQDNGVCLFPVTVPVEAKLNVLGPGALVEPANAELFAGYTEAQAAAAAPAAEELEIPFFGWDFSINPRNVLVLWIVAALGGFLLNFTPCVLPLVPIKILGLSRSAGNRSRCFMLGLLASLGVVAFWLALGIVIATVSGFSATNQLFQYPAFTITVGIVIAIMSVGMLGLFAVRLPQAVYMINPSHETLHGSFIFGIMIAVLSTPCTAPAMGAAAAWAATQSPAITLSTFAAIGVGMAAPYLLLSAFPALVDKMPRTGPASELIKQVMGLLMLAAAAYFVGTGLSGMLVDPPDPPTRMYWWAVAFFVAAAGAWLVYRTFRITGAPGKRLVWTVVGLLLITGGVYAGVDFTSHGPINWVYYTPQRLEAAREDRKIVVMEFTAEWCLNCKLLEEAVLNTDSVAELLNSPDVAPLKIDITGNNEAGNAKLIDVGRRTIPLLIVYDAAGREVLKSDAYTVQQVVDAIAEARTASVVGANQ